MNKQEFYTGQIIARCNSKLLEMKNIENKPELTKSQILYGQIEILCEILENIFDYKTNAIREQAVNSLANAIENDHYYWTEY